MSVCRGGLLVVECRRRVVVLVCASSLRVLFLAVIVCVSSCVRVVVIMCRSCVSFPPMVPSRVVGSDSRVWAGQWHWPEQGTIGMGVGQYHVEPVLISIRQGLTWFMPSQAKTVEPEGWGPKVWGGKGRKGGPRHRNNGIQQQQTCSNVVNPWQDTDLWIRGNLCEVLNHFQVLKKTLPEKKKNRDFDTVQLSQKRKGENSFWKLNELFRENVQLRKDHLKLRLTTTTPIPTLAPTTPTHTVTPTDDDANDDARTTQMMTRGHRDNRRPRRERQPRRNDGENTI